MKEPPKTNLKFDKLHKPSSNQTWNKQTILIMNQENLNIKISFNNEKNQFRNRIEPRILKF